MFHFSLMFTNDNFTSDPHALIKTVVEPKMIERIQKLRCTVPTLLCAENPNKIRSLYLIAGFAFIPSLKNI